MRNPLRRKKKVTPKVKNISQQVKQRSWIKNAPLPKRVYRATTAERVKIDERIGGIEPTEYSRHKGWTKSSPKAVYAFSTKAEFEKYQAPPKLLKKFYKKNKKWVENADLVMREKNSLPHELHPMEMSARYATNEIPMYRLKDESREGQLFKREKRKFSKETPSVQTINFEKFAKEYKKKTKMKVFLVEDLEMNKDSGAILVINEKGKGVKIPDKFIKSTVATDHEAFEKLSKLRINESQETHEEAVEKYKQSMRFFEREEFNKPNSSKKEEGIKNRIFGREMEIKDKTPKGRLNKSLEKNLERQYIHDLIENIGLEEAKKEYPGFFKKKKIN